MRTSQPQFIQELQHTTDGSSIRSSDDGSWTGGEERERAKLVAKIDAVKEKLKFINLQREGDVEEFLALSQEAEQQRGADNPQMARIQKHFEKKNKKHSHDTEALQKKLASYEVKYAELENGTSSTLDTSRTNVISTIGQGIKRTGANIKGMTESVIAGPMEVVHRLKPSWGSADNVNESNGGGADDSRVGHSIFYANSEHGSSLISAQPVSTGSIVKTKSSTLPAGMRMDLDEPLMTSTPNRGSRGEKRYSIPTQDAYSSSTEKVNIMPVVNEELLNEIRKLQTQLQKMESKCDKMAESFQNELADLNKTLDEERFKYKKLEEMMNETIELHQAEFATLKQEQKNIANRIDYQYQDRFRNVEENVEAVQNQMCRMENSIHHTLDVRLGGPGWANQGLLSFANILVELLKIFLFVVATVLDFIRPFTGSRTRAGIMITIILIVFIILQYVDIFYFFRRSTPTATSSSSEL